MNLKTLCMVLFLMTNYVLAQDSWERYKLCALNQTIQQPAPEQRSTTLSRPTTFPKRASDVSAKLGKNRSGHL